MPVHTITSTYQYQYIPVPVQCIPPTSSFFYLLDESFRTEERRLIDVPFDDVDDVDDADVNVNQKKNAFCIFKDVGFKFISTLHLS